MNPGGDFHQIQNYVLQLTAEKKLTASAYLLYGFYNSVGGFKKIEMGYEYISKNTGLSIGNISKSNKLLVKEGLISIHGNGVNTNYEIVLSDPRRLPRRGLVVVERPSKKELSQSEASSGESRLASRDESPVSPDEARGSLGEPTYTEKDTPKHITTTGRGLTKELDLLVSKFIEHWEGTYKSKYTKMDWKALEGVEHPASVLRYIPVLWSLDSEDEWVRNSDHSLTVFAKELKSGRLQSFYPHTRYYHKDKTERVMSGL
jgi:hypothetical protein